MEKGLAGEWTGLGMAVLATVLVRLAAPIVGKTSWLNGLDEETLSRVFPLAILFCLVFKEIGGSWESGPLFFVQVVGIAVVIGLHLWKRSLFLSVMGGTAIYVGLLNLA